MAKNACLAVGASFPCHKTVDYGNEDDEGNALPTGDESYCAGAIAFALNMKMENQILRIARRLGMWKPKDILGRNEVFGTISEMLTANREAGR